MRSPRLRLAFLTACVGLCLFFVLERSFLPGVPQRASFKGFDLLGAVARLVRNDYIEERDPARTMEGACRGLIDTLDPVSSYFGRDATAKYLRRESRWADIGIVLFKRSHGLFPQVAGLVEGSPADKAGVRLGDAVSAMDGRGTLDMSSLEANLYLKDLEQKPVVLKVIRDDQTLEVTVSRALLHAEPFTFTTEGAFAVLEVHGLYAPGVDDIRAKVVPLLKARKIPLCPGPQELFRGRDRRGPEAPQRFRPVAEDRRFRKERRDRRTPSPARKPQTSTACPPPYGSMGRPWGPPSSSQPSFRRPARSGSSASRRRGSSPGRSSFRWRTTVPSSSRPAFSPSRPERSSGSKG